MTNSTNDALVKISDLKKWFPVQQGWLDQALARKVDHVKAVDGISFEIIKGEVLGLSLCLLMVITCT